MVRVVALTAAVVALTVWLISPAAAPPPSAQSAPAAAQPQAERGPLDLIPAESLLAWKGLPIPGVERPEGPSAVDLLARLLPGMLGAQLDTKALITLDILRALGEVIHYPFAMALIDASAKPTSDAPDAGTKLDQFQIAIVVEHRGDVKRFARILQEMSNRFTDAAFAQLSRQEAERWTYQKLRDTRLPEWFEIAAGQIDDYFVITIGADVWSKVAAVAARQAPSIARDAWLDEVRAGMADPALIEVVVANKRIRQRLDPLVDGRATSFFEAWGSAEVDHTHWALGFKGRALYCLTHFRTGELTERRLYADPDIADPELLALIPPHANYAIYEIQIRYLLPKLISSYYATRSPDDRQRAVALWNRIQERLGVDAEKDALNHLGGRVVLLNDPPHPLRLPLAFTSLIPIRSEPQKVRQTLSTLCEAWQNALEEAADAAGEPQFARLYHDPDGIWSFQIGVISTLSWKITDKYIITCWSPDALREYLRHAGDVVGK